MTESPAGAVPTVMSNRIYFFTRYPEKKLWIIAQSVDKRWVKNLCETAIVLIKIHPTNGKCHFVHVYLNKYIYISIQGT